MFSTHLAYIAELNANNSRDRFYAHKELYDKLRGELIDFTQELIDFFIAEWYPLQDLNPKKCVFRINRDMRFSRDGQLYKKNMWLEVAPGGKRSGLPSFYVHIEAGNCFIGGGLYMPDKDITEAVRQGIIKDGKTLTKLYQDCYNAWFHPFADRALLKYPRGYDPHHEFIELIRQKDWIFSKHFTDKQFSSPNLLKNIKKELKQILPFNQRLLNATQV